MLLEAPDPADLEQRMQPKLYLPPQRAACLQREHPVLARIGAGLHVPAAVELDPRQADEPRAATATDVL